MKNRKTEPNKAEIYHTSKPTHWFLRRELGTQKQRDRPKCLSAHRHIPRCVELGPLWEGGLFLGHLRERATDWQEVNRKRGIMRGKSQLGRRNHSPSAASS